jgi:hypothetical protein
MFRLLVGPTPARLLPLKASLFPRFPVWYTLCTRDYMLSVDRQVILGFWDSGIGVES